MMIFSYDLRAVRTKSQLLTFIDIKEDWFDWVTSFDVAEYEKTINSSRVEIISTFSLSPFEKHEIPKRNPLRGTRIVWEAERSLNNTYKALARRLTHFFEGNIPGFPHARSFGYVRGRNIRNNASIHIGSSILLKTDIKNFFPSIEMERVQELFADLGVRRDVAALIASFLTIDGSLALGLPTSPIIANAICHQLDVELDKLAQKNGSAYTRYADDISFSSNENLPNVSEIANVVVAQGFELSIEKTRAIKRGQNYYVTGLSISAASAPHAPRRHKRDLRQELYFAEKYGLSGHVEHLGIRDTYERQRYINHIDGKVKYVAFHEPKLAKKIVPQWHSILDQSGDKPSFAPKNQNKVGFEFYVDETEFIWNGKNYLALGMSASQHQDLINDTAKQVLHDFLSNPWSDGKLSSIRNNGLHFVDATEDLRKAYIEALQKLPFNGYLVFGELASPSEYEAGYLRLLQHVIKRRLMAAESRSAKFHFEETDKVSKRRIEDVIRSSWRELNLSNNRHPRAIEVQFVSKNYVGVSVPDFLLGVFRRYMESGLPTSPPLRQHIMFERLRDKIRVIVNADDDEEFTRRNPLNKTS